MQANDTGHEFQDAIRRFNCELLQKSTMVDAMQCLRVGDKNRVSKITVDKAYSRNKHVRRQCMDKELAIKTKEQALLMKNINRCNKKSKCMCRRLLSGVSN